MTSKNLLRHFCEKNFVCANFKFGEGEKSFLAQGFAIESSGEAKLEEGVGGGGLFDFLLVLPSWNLLSHLADAFSSSST